MLLGPVAVVLPLFVEIELVMRPDLPLVDIVCRADKVDGAGLAFASTSTGEVGCGP